MSRLLRDPIDVRVPELRQPAQNREVEQRLGDVERAGDFWHVVGASGEVAFGSGWRPYPAGTPTTYFSPAYRKIGSVVYFRGMAEKTSAVAPPDTIFTLPLGYRPASQLLLTTTSGAVLARIDVTTAGAVIVQVGASSWVSLDGISFAL